ncbi:RNA polymerase sigma factor (sigma-70 family) [Planotetraspora sp. GP83]
MTSMGLSDGELARAAGSGDVDALGTLLLRHEAGMRAVALSLLGHGSDVEDAVQDAAVVALRRIGDLRDPEAVGAWLRMIVRNACRTRLRSAWQPRPLDDLVLAAADDESPERLLERHAMRDWIWRAIEELSPPLRMTVMLRHFSSRVTSYEQIAAVCGVPIGTVRSRLSQARAKLAEALATTASEAHADAAALAAASRKDALETLAAAEQGEFRRLLTERWAPDVTFFAGRQPVGGRELLIRGMESDLEAGVHQRFVDGFTSRDTTIWEMDLINPVDDPEHCPPAVTWVMSLEDGRVSQLRLFHVQAA